MNNLPKASTHDRSNKRQLVEPLKRHIVFLSCHIKSTVISKRVNEPRLVRSQRPEQIERFFKSSDD